MPTKTVMLDDLKQHIGELEKEFGKDASIAYANVSYTQLSVARHYGGAKVQGKYFVYNFEDDSLIREDVVKWMQKKLNPKKAKKKKASDEGRLFGDG